MIVASKKNVKENAARGKKENAAKDHAKNAVKEKDAVKMNIWVRDMATFIV